MKEDNTPTQTGEFLGLKPNYDTRILIEKIVAISPDPIVRSRTWGWFPRLVKEAFGVYLSHLTKQARKQ